jgi:hypothetical protein
MQLSPTKQHPDGGVVVEALMAIGSPIHLNMGEVFGVPLRPSQKQKEEGKWDDQARYVAAEAFIALIVNPRNKEPGARRYLPVVLREKVKLEDQMKQLDDMCRHVARGVYEVKFSQGYVDTLLEKGDLNPAQKEHLTAKFTEAKALRVKHDAAVAKRIAEGGLPNGMGEHPLEASFRELQETVATQAKQIQRLTESLLASNAVAKK